MQLYWGVIPLLGPYSHETDEMMELSLKCALANGAVKHGDSVVVTAGMPVGMTGSTNTIKVVTVSNALVKGTGIGRKAVTGRVCNCIRRSDYQEKLKKGDILVVDVLDDEFAQLAANRASAIIAEEGGLTSSTAIVGITCGIPVIIGVDQATALLWDEQLITVDPVAGIVYEGTINL